MDSKWGLAAGWAMAILAAAPMESAARDIPENPFAIPGCVAKVRVESARLRVAPSLQAPVLEVLKRESPVYVSEVRGKWARVDLENGATAYVAAYLLSFPSDQLLEHWKRGAPEPDSGRKKARAKWAGLFRLHSRAIA